MNSSPPRTVFDCVIYAQALMNPKGPAGGCLSAAESGACILYISPFVIGEIQGLPAKLDERFGITPDRVALLIDQIREFAVNITDVPVLFVHPSDPKDSAYINLAGYTVTVGGESGSTPARADGFRSAGLPRLSPAISRITRGDACRLLA